MTLKIRHLRLRAVTPSRLFGADISFVSGLNVVRAGNTSGKSTCLQSIIYALGLERSLGPQLEIPLPYAMRERIHRSRDEEYETVIESYVELEIENSVGEILTIHRDVVGGKDTKLIQTSAAPRLSTPNATGRQRDFFVHDPGAAQREDGFHTYLARFVGWDLPQVPRFDGTEAPLYLETLFPMFFVEQKRGWSATQGPFPTFLRIQDVARRVMEFILNLQAGHIRRERAELRRQISSMQQQWAEQLTQLERRTGNLVRLRGVPLSPSAELAHIAELPVEVLDGDDWQSIDVVIARHAERVRELEASELPTADSAAPELEQQLSAAHARIEELSALVDGLRGEFNIQLQEQRAIELRIDLSKIDLKRNQDALRLKRFGSQIGTAAGEQICPTCHQSISNELLPEVATVGMALEENITFVKSQLELYEATHAAALDKVGDIRARYYSADGELRERQQEVRGLRQALIQPSSSPSRAVIEELVRRQTTIARLTSARELVDGATDVLRKLALEWAELQDRIKRLVGDDLTDSDVTKITSLEESIRKQLGTYGFRSFQPTEIHLSRENFRPLIYTREDGRLIEREISFEVSASDAIRLKWAYYLSLTLLAKRGDTNHPRIVIFDEPGQQEMEVASLVSFLRQAAETASPDQQVIVGTSESIVNIEDVLRDAGAHLISFEGFILQPLN